MDDKKSDYTELLFEAIASLKDAEECRSFFGDLCTSQEIKAFAQRIEIARLLGEGRVYSDIMRITGASTAIISRVKRSIGGGYGIAFSRLSDGDDAR